MKKKKILFIYQKKAGKPIPFKDGIHMSWVNDCRKMYDTQYWGKGFTNTSFKSLQNKINTFKPDFIYLTMRKRYLKSKSEYWLPDLTNIKVPKIFVECDSYKWDRMDNWYNQFDKVYCRQAVWGYKFHDEPIVIENKFKKNSATWKKVPVFRWSAPKAAFTDKRKKRKGIYFFGSIKRGGYTARRIMWKRFREVKFRNLLRFRKELSYKYWNMLHTASALLCPTESDYGSFVPAKLFEYAASGAAVITNCDYVGYGMKDLKGSVIEYTNLDSLEDLFGKDFSSYHGKAVEVVRNHTHEIRYKELFR